MASVAQMTGKGNRNGMLVMYETSWRKGQGTRRCVVCRQSVFSAVAIGRVHRQGSSGSGRCVESWVR